MHQRSPNVASALAGIALAFALLAAGGTLAGEADVVDVKVRRSAPGV